ncbi:kinase [Metamycoplasma alkalescens]|nr:kinase [Metamycoplasma alkalescens]
MASTILGAEEVKLNDNLSISNASSAIAQNMLFSARGNSGVILSQIFKGFSVAFQNKKDINSYDLVRGFEEAAKYAYNAVLKPIEGTILTVIREISEGLKESVLIDTDIIDVLKLALNMARKSCDNTPNLLTVLKEVNVTDSGGEGLYAIIEGILAYFEGNAIKPLENELEVNKFISDTEVFDGEFGYCTEFIVELKKPKKFNKESLISKLEKHGNSMVVVKDDTFLKIHIHAAKPGNILNIVDNLGQFVKIKIENMTLQANNSKKNSDSMQSNDNTDNKPKKSAIISCNTGSGIINLLKENGASYIIEGGQTNNPSIKDIIFAIESINAETIFILPNNSNIILSAQQASTIIKDKKIIIIPTKSQAQSLSILYNFNEDNSPEDNHELMNNALSYIHYGEIAPSIKTTKLNNIKVRAGSFMVINEGKLVDTAPTFNEAAYRLLDELIHEDTQLVTVFYGQGVTEADINDLKNYIEINYNITFEIYDGGQDIYPYLIAAE